MDALDKGLQTASPTTSRTSRNFLLSLVALLGWSSWTADVATAFLQGMPQTRQLWVKLPAECLQLLGAGPETRMLLLKPVYGQLDAPRRWYLEAVRRLRELGLRQHILDPCCFLAYEADFNDGTSTEGVLGPQRLCGCICLHVDDMLGGGNPNSPTWQRILTELRTSFNFREWKDGDELEYCGATLQKLPNGGLRLQHEKYVQKICPVTVAKGQGPDAELTSREVTSMRGLVGALQWPSTQSSPHLQASVSLAAGQVNGARVEHLNELNKTLKFAKQNADVGLNYEPLGPIEKLRIITLFDASFGSRPDGSSQGGYMVMLAPEHTLQNQEDSFHLLEWRSLKLPRVARSSLSAETQAAAHAADATDLICRFFDHLCNPDLKLATLLQRDSVLRPVLVTDAKALYDSYYRESVTGGVVDRRTALEIRVVKELITDLSGELRWVSSERQWADGLTKLSARQLLASRLRHGKIGFFWDPSFVAAKKKTATERQANMDAYAEPPPKRANRTHYDENPDDEKVDDTQMTGEMMEPVECFVSTSYVAYTDEMIEYKDAIQSKTGDIVEYDLATAAQLRSFTSDILSMPFWLFAMIFLLILYKCLRHAFAWVWNRAYARGCQDTTDALLPELQQSRALAVVFGAQEEIHRRIAAEYRAFEVRRDILEDADEQRDDAIHIMRRALLETFNHADLCPLNDAVWLTEDRGLEWHASPQCPRLPGSPLRLEREVRRLRPCPRCSSGGVITPYIRDRFGQTLLQELEGWIVRQGAEAWPIE